MHISHILKRIRQLILQVDTGDRRTISNFSETAVKIKQLVCVYYAILAFLIMINLQFANAFIGFPLTDPLWPVVLIDTLIGIEWLERVTLITSIGALTALLAVLFPGVFIFRLIVFLYCFLFVAVSNSYGSTNNGRHLYVYASFALLFLPPSIGRPDKMTRKDAMSCNVVFWFTQCILLFSYSLSGFWKLAIGGLELFSSDAFVRVVLDRMMNDPNFTSVPPMVPLAVPHPLIMQFFYLCFIYVQFFMLIALFRPHLQRAFGIVAILFHYGIGWLLGFSAYIYILIWAIFLVLSPFAPNRFSLSGTIRSLPILGFPFRLRYARKHFGKGAKKAWLVYDGECPFCSNYSRLVDVRNVVGELVLVNAREGGPLVEEIKALPYDLNKGMVLKMNGRYYTGDDALHTLALLPGKKSTFNVFNHLFFGSRAIAWLVYPLLKLGRRLTLIIKRVPLIAR